MARAAAEGHRVVLVVCTDGDHGESPDDLGEGETLVDRRRREAATSAARARRRPDRLARLPGLRDDGVAAERRSGVVLAGRRRRGRRAVGRDPARGARRRRRPLRLARRLRPPRPHPGPPRRPPRRRPRGHAEAVRGRRSTATSWWRCRRTTPNAPDDFDPNGPADDGNPFGTAEAEHQPRRRRVGVHPTLKRQALAAHASQVTDIGMFLAMPDEVFDRFFGTEWFIEPGAGSGPAHRLAAGRRVMAIVHLARHGRATGGWDADPDPGLDDVGVGAGGGARRSARPARARGSRIVTSPMRRCRETAAPLARRWGVTPVVEPLVAEMPVAAGCPDGWPGADWLRQAMAGTWSDLGDALPRVPRRRRRLRRRASRRHRRHVALRGHQRRHRRLHRRRPARHPQPRQRLGDRRRDGRRPVACSSAGGDEADTLIR